MIDFFRNVHLYLFGLGRKLFIIFGILIFLLYFYIPFMYLYRSNIEYKYIVEIKDCESGKLEVVEFRTKGDENEILTLRRAVPVLKIGKKTFVNICDYKIISKNKI
jgi:hypothetical protein